MDREQAKIIIENFQTIENNKIKALSELKEYDYIGRKISEALLLGNEGKIAALREEYSDIIAQADILRSNINKYDADMKEIYKEYLEAIEIINTPVVEEDEIDFSEIN